MANKHQIHGKHTNNHWLMNGKFSFLKFKIM